MLPITTSRFILECVQPMTVLCVQSMMTGRFLFNVLKLALPVIPAMSVFSAMERVTVVRLFMGLANSVTTVNLATLPATLPVTFLVNPITERVKPVLAVNPATLLVIPVTLVTETATPGAIV